MTELRGSFGIAVASMSQMTRISALILLSMVGATCDVSSPTGPTVVVSRTTFTTTPSTCRRDHPSGHVAYNTGFAGYDDAHRAHRHAGSGYHADRDNSSDHDHGTRCASAACDESGPAPNESAPAYDESGPDTRLDAGCLGNAGGNRQFDNHYRDTQALIKERRGSVERLSCVRESKRL